MSLYISNSKNSTNGKIPKALIIFLILFLLTEFMVSIIFSSYIENPSNTKIKAKHLIALKADQDYDILILGDSSAAGAINANELKKQTGLNSFNFALTADATIAGTYFLFKDYLKYNNPPKYIIIMNIYDAWHRGLESKAVMATLVANFQKDLIKSQIGTSLFFNLNHIILKNYLNYGTPSLIHKYEIRKLIRSKNIIKYYRELMEKQSQMEQELINSSGSSLYAGTDVETILMDAGKHKNFIDDNLFQVSEINRYYLNELLNEAQKRNILIFIIYPPILKDFYEDNINNEYLVSYKSFIEGIGETNSNALLLYNNFYLVEREKLSSTIDHLNHEESKVFTKDLANRIISIINQK